jgi:hypothetical protein
MNDAIEPSTTNEQRTGISRRGLVGGIAIGTGVVGAVAAGAAIAGATGSGYRKDSLVVDVACLADQWVQANIWPEAPDDDSRTPFLVEGWIYPAGTIAGDGFIPLEDGSIGRWFCRGFGVSTLARGEPHVNTHQDYVFGVVGADDPFPDDTLSTVGLEGTVDTTKLATRAVIGGTGRYFAATGQMQQQFIAWNTTRFPASSDLGFCWRMTFDLRLLD